MRNDTNPSGLTCLRSNQAQAAIVFIHGFTGGRSLTWKNFHPFVANELPGWDMWTFGYSSKRGLDIPWMWAADASIEKLAGLLRSQICREPLAGYNSLALVSHSMGGLVAQKAIVDDLSLALRVSHLFLFGTPSNGLVKAGLARLWKRQLRDMAASGSFINRLRLDWDALDQHHKPYHLTVVAGERDEFVPTETAHGPFPRDVCVNAPGNHVTMLNCTSTQDLAIRHVVDGINSGSGPTKPVDSVHRAISINAHRQLVNRYLPDQKGLDDEAFVDMILALEELGQQGNALHLLKQRRSRGTDVVGVLAGRLKRRWLTKRQKSDAEGAIKNYQIAYDRSVNKADYEQAAYHGINLAFLSLVFQNNKEKACTLAEEVMSHCGEAPADHWGRATMGEACLILGNVEQALKWYARAIELNPPERDVGSMSEQAMEYIKQMPDRLEQQRLTLQFYNLFAGNSS
ncbi:tetratricopeptide repeat-containing protein [Magnetococcus sp. PR-3]|uniref:tetratricopeptide repeat-containing protein n=1 Tax=Magnetococcus sp. PR-3 TaxID=3120355 RepID=UPI002FCE17A3